MNIKVDISFEKDLRSIKDDKQLRRVFAVIKELGTAKSLEEIKSVRKLKGGNNYFRLRIGDYRIGFSYQNDEIILYRFLHRKEIYKYFP